jgi:radical SAM enzyme (TIGR01210 family)
MAISQTTNLPAIVDRDIIAARPAKNAVDPRVPYAFFVEPEHSAAGTVDDVATLFLTNRECPFHCLYCDLWKNTTDERVPVGAIPAQIDHALSRLSPARHIKLYNSGNFFDAQAIPPEDHRAIAERVARFETVIVENHPLLCGPACVEFRDLLWSCHRGKSSVPELEVALGLETVHPGILPELNKRMTLDDFRLAAEFLRRHAIAARAFILLRPPGMVESECVAWALKAIEFAFDCGVRVCAVIPTRGGNGIMERLHAAGEFGPPRLSSLEETLDLGLALKRGRVFVDLWDVERFYDCPACGPARAARLREMNLSQHRLPPIVCDACEKQPKMKFTPPAD